MRCPGRSSTECQRACRHCCGLNACRSRRGAWASTGPRGGRRGAKYARRSQRPMRPWRRGEWAGAKADLGGPRFPPVNEAGCPEIYAEGSLRQAADTFTRRFKEVEAAMKAEGRQVEEASAEELDRQWLAVKAREGLARSGEPS